MNLVKLREQCANEITIIIRNPEDLDVHDVDNVVRLVEYIVQVNEFLEEAQEMWEFLA